MCMNTNSRVKRKSFYRKSELQMFLLISGGHIGGPKRSTKMASPYKALQGVWNVSANNSETAGHKDLRLGRVVYILVFYNISFCCLLPLDGFQFIFSLHGSLSRYIVEVKFPQILFEWANVYANVKVLQVRLQHSPDLKLNAKILSLLPFQHDCVQILQFMLPHIV